MGVKIQMIVKPKKKEKIKKYNKGEEKHLSFDSNRPDNSDNFPVLKKIIIINLITNIFIY